MLIIIKSLWPKRTSLKCLSLSQFYGLFEWVVMTFGLKNAGATYQRAMNLIFHDLLGIILEVYIYDVIVKSDSMDSHLANLRLTLERMCRYGLKMNPLKCVFSVLADKFLGFLIHEHGIEVDPTKIESINKVQPLQCKNDMQKFLGKVNYLIRFISNLSEKISAFAPILRLKNEAEFTWGADQQHAFENIKQYLSSSLVVKAPMAGTPFRLYITAEDAVIRAVLMQVMEGREHTITHLSQRVTPRVTKILIKLLKLQLRHQTSTNQVVEV
jgi:hypothetical protein